MRLFLFVTLLLTGLASQATFIPEDEIVVGLVPVGSPNMSEADFKQLLSRIQNEYAPIAAHHGGQLTVSGSWRDEKLNAGANQIFNRWMVQITGGLARRPELTPDGFTLIVCHELGHHLAGFAFAKAASPMGGTWAATEGQSDYFATQVCARKLWANESVINEAYRQKVNSVVQQKCDSVWNSAADQNLCYRVLSAVESMTLTMANLMKKAPPQFNTPDETVVPETSSKHPAVQCRMDTSLQGAICPVSFDHNLIPGKKTPGGVFSIEAEREAAMNSCTTYSNFSIGLRPACWFKARL